MIESPEAGLKVALAEANDAYARASRSLDAADLEPCFAGAALERLAGLLRIGKREGFFIEFSLHSVEHESLEIADDGRAARVVTSETWESTARDVASGRVLRSQGPRRVRQEYRLRLSGDAWQIVDFREDSPDSR